ncbi:AcrR family transcriptional regulator [Rhodopseudomonas rhenobacensis]|uniref:AcrR family transcriptional regulator n=1 Tax=Rhodopseudomonas rhenobacensis TaxID=87461 RepID=A0A7W7Z659_9BRAD|nr:AcrR family transcriptional regulator [Rhodopseudomonas rhenobacensis]
MAAILQAAGRVLAGEGARRFTAARVAEAAGVSVGSLYQYFPNKEAILFQLQADEWQQTGGLLAGILADRSRPPAERLRIAVREFVRTECEEAQLRGALDDAAPLYRDAPEARRLRLAGTKTVRAFMREALPECAEPQRLIASDVVMMAMAGVGKQLSETEGPPAAVDARARALGEMLCAYLDMLQAKSVKSAKPPSSGRGGRSKAS